MQSNMHDFPAEEFMECLRNNLSNHAKYLEEVNNLNTYTWDKIENGFMR